MYTRITEAGGRRYLQLVEGHRDEAGKVRSYGCELAPVSTGHLGITMEA